jgi:hypothetical protein
MNKIALNKMQTKYLLTFPESGMGYQIVNILMDDGSLLKNKTVLNSTFLNIDEFIDVNKIKEIFVQ